MDIRLVVGRCLTVNFAPALDRIVVNFNYQEGGRPVSLEEVLGSFLDGNGAPKESPHGVSRRGGFTFGCTLGGLEQGDGTAVPEPTVLQTVG